MKLSDTSVKIYLAKKTSATQVENGVALPAFKAYIEVDNAAGAAVPLFIALPTAVEAAKVQTTKAGATYDLTDRRVQQTAKGQVYVRDGKQFVQQ